MSLMGEDASLGGRVTIHDLSSFLSVSGEDSDAADVALIPDRTRRTVARLCEAGKFLPPCFRAIWSLPRPGTLAGLV